MNSSFLNSSKPTKSLAQQHFFTVLESHQTFAQLRAGLEQVTVLAQDVAASLPDYLAPHVWPGLIKDRTLNLFTTNGAFAGRLHHFVPSLILALQQRGWLVQALRIRVQPYQANPTNVPPAVKEARISATGFTQLRQLSEQLEPSPLQAALAQMVRRHQKTVDSGS